MQNLDHATNAYLAVTLSPASAYYHNPSTLSSFHPAVHHIGQLGVLSDVQLLSIPKTEWDLSRNEITSSLRAQVGVLRVDVQEVKQRVKRGGDEL
ncbi:hypothetical protein FIBSPDRAFT_123312 [Athelia psychrophila]|uniref:Uncharacterized protein n=1 Tax=Athelia psychrophila TaxID=1759441 RepID=A0A167U1H2_9AGAM|nr:hypothetical protein FIBSPDRAFT_844915 [Fibularhizoctonia sp. CBS 109695]KZP13831.1 hypothetical protein FIBSPDRAFT_123312 [Fibularhizoctonia sp. CBS 109695]